MAYIPDSAEMVRALLEAEDIANRASQPVSSVHLLLALFTFPNRAQVLLGERGIDEDRLLGEIRVVEDEPPRTVARIKERARDLAKGAGADDVDSLHLLIALTRLRDAFAYKLLERTGTSLTSLRNVAVSYVTGNMPRRYRSLPKPETRPAAVVASRPRTKVRAPAVQEVEPPPADPEYDVADDEPYGEEDEFAPLAAAVQEAARAPALELQPAPASPESSPRATPYSLEEMAPNLAACGVDLTELAARGELDYVIGRDSELERLIDILGKRRSNNPVLVGPPGVGKTAIVEGLAMKIVSGDADVEHFRDRILFALDTGALVAGTSLRGAFSERMGAIKAEVAAAGGRIIVFIDELHTLIGAGTSGEGPQDAANELKTALARGEFPCIGATTEDEFKKYIEKDPALERRFDPISVQEPSADESILILEGAIPAYAQHHQVQYSLEALHASVQLTHRFVPERKLPDKAFAVVDLAGSRARRRGQGEVTRLDIARIINEWTGVPLERLAEADAERFNHAEEILGEKLIGHREALTAVCRAIRRGFAGFNGRRPIGNFLFLGPTGVGKTEMVKILAEFLFGRRDCIVRIDMSELSEAHSVSRLIGAQPGYVGYEEGGQLTEALRKRPFQIVLFDEVEKAHREVLNLMLQIMDEGHLTDSRGRRVSFANTLVILTSNLGADALRSGGGGRTMGFGSGAASREINIDPVLEAARGQLPPELWGRLDERLVFRPLTREQVRQIANLQLTESARTLFTEREITLRWDDAVLDFLLEHGGFTPETGARGMRQAIQRHIEAPIAEQILSGDVSAGDVARVALAADKQHVSIAAGSPSRRAQGS